MEEKSFENTEIEYNNIPSREKHMHLLLLHLFYGVPDDSVGSE